MADELSARLEVFGEMPSAAALKAFSTAVCQDLYGISISIRNLDKVETGDDFDGDVRTPGIVRNTMLVLSAAELPFIIDAYASNGCVETIVEAAKTHGIHVKFEVEGYGGDSAEMFFVKPNGGKGYESTHVPTMGDEIGMTVSQIEKPRDRGVATTDDLLAIMRDFTKPGPSFLIPDNVIDDLTPPRRRPK